MSAGPEQIAYRNDVVGETLVVAPPRPGDSVLRAELLVDAAHRPPPGHVHPRAIESFTVVEGALAVRVGRRRFTLHEGESTTVPAGVTHAYAGVSGTAARVDVELEPPGRMAEFFAAVYRLPQELRDPRTGQPKLSAVAALLLRYPDDVGVPVLPRALARPLLVLLAAQPWR